MKYLNRIKSIPVGILFSFLLSGCTDWLRVDPVDRVLEDQVFESEYNIQAALNGIYVQMGSDNLYGRDLTLRSIELLAQQYVAASGSATASPLKYYMTTYDFSQKETKENIKNIWSKAYSTILNINNFIVKVEATQGIIAQSKKDILLGEAYGLRAYMYLDLLRLFGPVYSEDPTAVSIPYHAKPVAEYLERVPASEIMGKIMEDLDKSLVLLQNDPVINEGVMAAPEDSLTLSQREIDPFYRYRNRRLNYYAAGTLKVRALMFRNDKDAAAGLAKELLDQTTLPEKFPWATSAKIFHNLYEDRIFSDEVLFGIHSSKMYTHWTDYFSPGITNINSICASMADDVKKTFDVTSGTMEASPDYRAKSWKEYPAQSNYLVTYKFSKSERETEFWYFQPLIRKSELYYALAECEEDVSYVDSVRIRRGILPVAESKASWTLETEILNEYKREFSGEGQLFYYYKRKNYAQIANSGTISMSKDKYMIPIPQEELDK